MPSGATTPYSVFVLLRFMNVIAFAATCAVATLMIHRGAGRKVVAAAVFAGAALSAVALYVYLAHALGLPEPPRTRMGTGGGTQLTTFSMAGFYLHRALGTFREPGHLAEWLVVPFFLSLSVSQWVGRPASIVIGVTLLLTVSMTGIGGAALGATAAVVLLRPGRRVMLQIARRLIPIVFAALVTGYASYASGAVLFGTTRASVLEVLVTRAPQILAGGIEFNRGYVYEGVRDRGLPLVGFGMGQASIAYSGQLIVSFLSLYVNTAYSVGLVGLALLALFLVAPVYSAAKKYASRESTLAQCAGMAYLSWLVMYGFGSEELTVMSAVAYALLSCGHVVDGGPTPAITDEASGGAAK
jgi:hypothetical protein